MREHIEKSMTFPEYINLIEDLLEKGKTTGENQSEQMFHYAKLNRQRMKRLEKTVVINEKLKEKIRSVRRPLLWLIITEGWCGDAAQNIPAIEKMAAENPLIQTRYLLRDEILELMDKYLTNGGRAIPILICLDGETFEEMGRWGSRPTAIQEYFLELKTQGLEKPEISELIQRRYNADKEQSIQEDFFRLLDVCFNKTLAANG